MDFIKIGEHIFSVRTIEQVYIKKERNSYFIYVLTRVESIRTVEYESEHQAECKLDEIYKMLNTEIIKEEK